MLTLPDAIKRAIDNLPYYCWLTFANVILLKAQSVNFGADSAWVDNQQLAEEPERLGKQMWIMVRYTLPNGIFSCRLIVC